MGQRSFRRLLPVLIPLALLAAFALMITFPSLVPFLNVRLASAEGLDSETFTVSGKDSDRGDARFVMKLVPAGRAPGGTMDLPGALAVSSPFWLGRTEVTRGLYGAVAASGEARGYELAPLPPLPAGVKRGSANSLPVEEITWFDAVVWCNLLSELTGLEPVYRFPGADGGTVRKVSDLAALCAAGGPAVNAESRGFRLPSSQEWEFAARYRDGSQWTSGTWPSGGVASWIEYSRSDLVAHYDRENPAPVASLASNGLGIFDMSGNVWEWCLDAFTDPESADSLPKRVTRGGSWMGNAWRIQIGGAFGTPPGNRERGQGFRVARNR